jgi:hypothetical protein
MLFVQLLPEQVHFQFQKQSMLVHRQIELPRNVTLSRHTVHGGLQMTNGTLALVDTLFQEVYICAFTGSTSRDYNSRPEAQISMLSRLCPFCPPGSLPRMSRLTEWPPE